MANSTKTRLQGRVKIWKAGKGYGFIARYGERDIFVHVSALSTDLRRLADGGQLEGTEVTFTVTKTPKGLAAGGVQPDLSGLPEEYRDWRPDRARSTRPGGLVATSCRGRFVLRVDRFTVENAREKGCPSEALEELERFLVEEETKRAELQEGRKRSLWERTQTFDSQEEAESSLGVGVRAPAWVGSFEGDPRTQGVRGRMGSPTRRAELLVRDRRCFLIHLPSIEWGEIWGNTALLRCEGDDHYYEVVLEAPEEVESVFKIGVLT